MSATGITRSTAPAGGGGVRVFVKALVRRPLFDLAVAWLLIVILLAIFAPLIAPYGPTENDLLNSLSGPTSRHWLGTDTLGRDTLSRIMFGAPVTLFGILEALATYIILGTLVGIVAGYAGKWVDEALGRLGDLLLALPVMIVLLCILSVFTNNQTAAMFALGALAAPGLARVARAATLATRKELYIDAAKVSGLRSIQILGRHVLPRISSAVIVQASLFAAIALLVQCGVNFLGFGTQPPDPSWGGLVADASKVIQRQAWMLFPTGGVIFLTVVALGLIGNAVRDVSTERWSGSKLAPRRTRARVLAPTDRLNGHPAGPGSLLSLRGLHVEFPGRRTPFPVVKDVSLDIAAGETVGLVGESGCGKTMTAMGILGLIPGRGRVTRGSCVFAGEDLLQMDAKQLSRVRGRGIGFVSQEPMVALDPTFTVGSQIAEAVRRHHGIGRRAARRRAVELLEKVSLPEPHAVAKRYVYQLSGGMAQRVVIALALAGDPRLLIADEPTSALDVSVQSEILDLLRDLQTDTGMSILLVTHDWGVVADACHRAVVMYAGEVVEAGDVKRLFERPCHPYTKGLLEADPYRGAQGEALRTIPGVVPLPQDWPRGCHFQARCDYATAECGEGPVPLVEPESGHVSRCLRVQALLAGPLEPADVTGGSQ
jgi:peptide/nickel transport system permease protein